MLKKLNTLTGIYRRKITTMMLEMEIKNMEKASYLTLWERMELNRAKTLLNTLK